MGTARSVLAVLGLLGAACAQQQIVQQPPPVFLMRFGGPDLQQRYAQEGSVTAVERLARLVERLLRLDSAVRIKLVVFPTQKDSFHVRASTEQMQRISAVIEQLHQERPPRARLQCSLVTMPLAVAKAHGLGEGRIWPFDEAAFGKLVRDAVAAKGTLQNLPEVLAAPLAPFAIDPPGKAAKVAAVPDQRLRVRGEMVPASAGKVFVSMDVVRGLLPADPTVEPGVALLYPLFELAAGESALALDVAGDDATVLFVRCIDVASEPPPEEKSGR